MACDSIARQGVGLWLIVDFFRLVPGRQVDVFLGDVLMGSGRLSLVILTLLCAVWAVSCGVGWKYKKVRPLAVLEVAFRDPVKWDGIRVSAGETCNTSKVYAETPALVIRNIPEGANAIIMEYSDRDLWVMNRGGHGRIGYALPEGAGEIIIPPVPANTLVLPDGFFIVSRHKNLMAEKGAYMPPCSGGVGNEGRYHEYSLTVMAVYHAPSGKEKSRLLGRAEISLGRY